VESGKEEEMFKIKTNTREFVVRDTDEELLFNLCVKTVLQHEEEVVKEYHNSVADFLEKQFEKEIEQVSEECCALVRKPAFVPDEVEEEPAAEERSEEPVEHYDSGTDVEYDETPKNKKRFKGFVHMECEHCGEITTTCLKGWQLHFTCKHCAQPTKMTDYNMRKVNMKCQCGTESWYHTNRIEGMFDIECVNCGNPVTVEWNKKEKAYVTIGGAY
jgi:hypothetical protein